MIDLFAIGVGACFAGSGALAWAAARCDPNPVGTPAARLHVSAVEEAPVSAWTGVPEGLCLYGANTAAVGITYRYCPAELRVTPHVERETGGVRCWGCPEGDQ